MNSSEPKWPNGKNFAVCLTHDVDRVKKTYQYFTHLINFLSKLQIAKSFNEILCFFIFFFCKDPKKDPYWNFEIIMDLEKKLNVKSTFYFLNESGKIKIFRPKTWKLYLGRYNIKNPEIVKIIKKLDSEGWEIGLHGSYRSYENQNLLQKEKKELENILGKRVYGVRQHYGNLKIPETWKLQEALGFKYDTTLGIQNSILFKEHKYLPFHPFNSSFLEIPLSPLMDHLLFSKSEKKNEVWEECKHIIEEVEKKNGVLNIIWHDRVFKDNEFPGRREIYERIIKLCQEKNAWITTGHEIAKWWNLQ